MNGQEQANREPAPAGESKVEVERDYATEEDERELRPRNPWPARPGTPEVDPPPQI